MGILTYIVAAIGFFIKLVLSYIFPEIKLNEKGIKFLGKDMVFWKDIKSITTRRDKFLNQTIIIKKRNGRINVTTIKDVEFSNLQIYLKSFLKKYGNIQ